MNVCGTSSHNNLNGLPNIRLAAGGVSFNQLNIKWCKDHVSKGLYGKHQSTNKHILGNHTETVKTH